MSENRPEYKVRKPQIAFDPGKVLGAVAMLDPQTVAAVEVFRADGNWRKRDVRRRELDLLMETALVWVLDHYPVHMVSHVWVEDYAHRFGRGPQVVTNPIQAESVSVLRTKLQGCGYTVGLIDPAKAKMAVGLDVRSTVSVLKRSGLKPWKITKELKDRTYQMAYRMTDLGKFTEHSTQMNQHALGDAVAICLAGMAQARGQRLAEMANG